LQFFQHLATFSASGFFSIWRSGHFFSVCFFQRLVVGSCAQEIFWQARHHDYPTFSFSQESSKIEILEPSPPFGIVVSFDPLNIIKGGRVFAIASLISFTHPPLPEVWPTPELLGTQKLTVFSFHIA
jgi:hypothetical protein